MPKQLENLSVHQFRGLRNLELRDLGRVNILVGPNNSGKTSVLEAVSVYCRPLSLFAWLETATARSLTVQGSLIYTTRTILDDLKWIFPQDMQSGADEGFDGHVSISGTGEFSVIEASADIHEFVGSWEGSRQLSESDSSETEDLVEQGELLRRGADLKLSVSARPEGLRQHTLFGDEEQPSTVTFRVWERRPVVGRDKYRGPTIPVATVSPFSQRHERFSLRHLTQAEIKGYKDEVIDLIRVIEPDIVDLEILSPGGDRPLFSVRHAQLGLAPLNAFGDGVRRMLVIALVLPSVAGGVLLIDEIEASIHVSALRSLFGWIVDSCKKYDVQVFATTHSLEAIDAIVQTAGEHLEDVVGYSLYADHKQTGVKRYTGDMLRRIRLERGLDIRGG
jgi:hypothetical protein